MVRLVLIFGKDFDGSGKVGVRYCEDLGDERSGKAPRLMLKLNA